MAVVITLRASTLEQLDPFSDWVHDAYFQHEAVRFDPGQSLVSVEFAQERGPNEQLPGPKPLRRTWRYDESLVPFLRCTLRVRNATGVEKDESRFDQPGMLEGISFDGAVKLEAFTGPAVTIPVTELDVELAVTDDVAFPVRRRVGRWTSIESDQPLDDGDLSVR